MDRIREKRNSKTPLIIAIVAALLLIGGAVALAYTQKWGPFAAQDQVIDGVNYGPPTDEEVENSQDAKKDIIDEEDTENEQTGDLKQVNIGVSHSDVIDDNLEVRAFVSGVVEGTGTCTATLSKTGSQTVSKSGSAFVNASTSQCRPILIPLSEFDQTGDWILVVSYKSSTSTGESEQITVNI